MLTVETSFDIKKHHIHLDLTVESPEGIEYNVDAILDTGAPVTEFSDHFLIFTGFLTSSDKKVSIKSGLQSQKYNMISIPEVKICGHIISEMEVYVSRFEESWGIDAQIGLDFFRRFFVEIDYSRGIIKTRPLKNI